MSPQSVTLFHLLFLQQDPDINWHKGTPTAATTTSPAAAAAATAGGPWPQLHNYRGRSWRQT